MSDNESEADILDLVGGDSESEQAFNPQAASDAEGDADVDLDADGEPEDEPQRTQPAQTSRSPSPIQSREIAPDAVQEQSPAPTKGIARRKNMKATTVRKLRRTADSDEEANGKSPAASDVESLGSGAMSESEPDDEQTRHAPEVLEEGPLFALEGKFESVEDKARIMAMSEVERESELADRAAKAERRQQNIQLRRLLQARGKIEAKAAEKLKRKAATTDLDESPRKSNRPKTKATERLDEYKRHREQKHEQRRNDQERRNRGRKSASDDEARSDVDADGDSDAGNWTPEKQREPIEAAKPDPPAELKDYERVRVGRSNFAKVCFYPGFEDAISGCFTRVNIGPEKTTGQNQYRMAQIKGFTTGRTYTMEGSNGKPFHTDQHALVTQGKAEKEWPFVVCSDSKFSEAEFERYKRIVANDNARMPTLSVVKHKLAGIHKLLDHKWTEEQISAKLKRSGVLKGKYAMLERSQIMQLREKAIASGNEAEIAKCDQELAALEGPKLGQSGGGMNANGSLKAQVTSAPSQQDRLAAINRANRAANSESIRKAQLASKRAEQRLSAAVAKGEAVADRFARVKTRARVHYNESKTNKKEDDLFGDSREGTPVPDSHVDTPRSSTPLPGTKVEKKGGAGGHRKRNNEDDVLAAMDLGIDIDI